MKKKDFYVRNHYLHEIIVSSYKGFIECTSAKLIDDYGFSGYASKIAFSPLHNCFFFPPNHFYNFISSMAPIV